MPSAPLNGLDLVYDDTGGDGEPVVLVNGTGATRTAWRAHQTPALTAAGYRVIAPDNRGIAPNTAPPGGVTLAAMAADVAALIDHLALPPCRVVGFSLGASIVGELLFTRPELVDRAVLMAGRARADAFGAAVSRAAADLYDSGTALPASHQAVFQALSYLSPHTLRDPAAVQDWLDIFTYGRAATGPGVRAQYEAMRGVDQLPRYATLGTPLLCVGFTDDVMIPAAATREIAETAPGARYTEIARCGHYGHLERPAEVNTAMLDFFARRPEAAHTAGRGEDARTPGRGGA
ncbi:alpha/beta fold hydrolase [Streptomyces californicus]|uniref:alpha/beta fold hydrolase n=1 Tax=Streptomyces californicus TaxID=67351 RepID=UPI00067C1D8B|nr:alpha/beta hydrolase [Streptomyces californicus]